MSMHFRNKIFLEILKAFHAQQKEEEFIHRILQTSN